MVLPASNCLAAHIIPLQVSSGLFLSADSSPIKELGTGILLPVNMGP